MRLLSMLVFVVAFMAMAAPLQKATIATNAQCGMCKATIEKGLYAIDGVKKAKLDLETKAVDVKFNDKKVSLDDIRTAISNLGYQADDVAPNPEAQAALAECCKPKKKGSCCASKSSCASKKKTSCTATKKSCNKKDGSK